MAGNKTTYLENKLLDHVLRGVAYVPPAAIYIGLFTEAPTDAGGGTEVSSVDTGYARVQVTFEAPINGSAINDAAVVFAKSTRAWGAVTHFALFDAETGGEMLFHGKLSDDVNIEAANRKIEFEPGAVSVTED